MCSGGELPEVEIISLLEEQIPRYRLRADTLTQFTGEQTLQECINFFNEGIRPVFSLINGNFYCIHELGGHATFIHNGD